MNLNPFVPNDDDDDNDVRKRKNLFVMIFTWYDDDGLNKKKP